MSTILDVAARAGVSVATVSRVINGSGTVSEKTVKKVMDAIDELSYNPNSAARNLKVKRAGLIIVILPSISNSFYTKIVRGMEDAGRASGYNVLLCTTGGDKSREATYLDMVKSRQADGVIFLSSTLTAEEINTFGKNYPAVLACENKNDADVVYVGVNDFDAAYDMTKHLIDIGHKNIAMISARGSGSSRLRELGFKKALAEKELSPAAIEYGNYMYAESFEITLSLLKSKPDTSAIFAISDVMAIGSAKACHTLGLKVPEDISIAGFDNITFSRMLNTEMTTVSQPRYQIGQSAMQLLIDQIEKGTKKQKSIYLEHSLVIRESTTNKDI